MRAHLLAVVVAIAVVLLTKLAMPSTASARPPSPFCDPACRLVATSTTHRRVVGYGQTRFDGLGPEAWARRARYWRRAYVRERRRLLRSPTVTEALALACATYGNCSTLWRKARCETGGTFSPTAHNPSGASGLFQFMPSTWRSTPYAALSIWSPYANALAAGWMHVHGRGGEWACR